MYVMLNTLFKTENIKYVISVDDCFAIPEEETLREELFVDSMVSFDKLAPFFIKYGKEEQVNDIHEMLEIAGETEAAPLKQSLLDSLDADQIKECLNSLHPDRNNLSEEQQGILDFLSKLQSDGIIERFETLPSTHIAEAFDTKASGMEDGAILWLIDKSFSNAKESTTAGIELAKNKVEHAEKSNQFIFMLTTIDSTSEKEEDIEREFDKMLIENGAEKSSFVYYINKKLVIAKKYDRIAKSLAFGFKRKQCYKLMELYTNCLRLSCDKTSESLHDIDQKTLNYVFTEKVQALGESHFDFFDRLVQIFHEDEYRGILAQCTRDISCAVKHYQELCDGIPQESGNQADALKSLSDVRKKELYDTHINQRHSEISTGDIFIIDSEYYILVTQSCDTYIRKDGKRKLEKAILLNIGEGSNTGYQYTLSCFCDSENAFSNPSVKFQKYCIVPFEILDLCVTNENGKSNIAISCFDSDYKLDVCYTTNYTIRHKLISSVLSEIHKQKRVVDDFLEHPREADNIAEIKEAYNLLLSRDNMLNNFEIDGSSIVFPVQRVARLNELNTISLLKEYGNVLSRVGQPFDFIKKENMCE